MYSCGSGAAVGHLMEGATWLEAFWAGLVLEAGGSGLRGLLAGFKMVSCEPIPRRYSDRDEVFNDGYQECSAFVESCRQFQRVYVRHAADRRCSNLKYRNHQGPTKPFLRLLMVFCMGYETWQRYTNVTMPIEM